ncbi:hypothetical protein F5J12DRAFT_186651 [Pisolithus orientalis]|uniref:uncharacterized protein n=1 Tax=Pisolithus orientalis TaxID=936130 RepID=UPI0022249ECE|nr:uncharacterized protein F5J12DRAFT_186651 [Pisolithus orientalis]KAI6032831.1 hypothetical protein F5J12DRAFT_186651 [Pisolithus orientalis]
MSLSMLVGGSECGPTNPLQGLTNRFDQDRGPQQDLLARAGPAKETFRTPQSSTSSELQRDVAQFFSPPTSDIQRPVMHTAQFQQQQRFQQQPFDMLHLQESLPQLASPSGPNTTTAQPPRGAFADAGWAGDFLQTHHRQPQSVGGHGQTQGTVASSTTLNRDIQEPALPFVSAGPQAWEMYTGYRMGPMNIGGMTLPIHGQTQAQGLTDRMLWDKEFQSQESLLSLTSTSSTVSDVKQKEGFDQQTQQPSTSAESRPTDEMARLAAQVIDSVKHEENPKFTKSSFMSLMRQLRDGEVVVDQEGFVPSDLASTSTSAAATATGSMKGKGKARAVDVLGTEPKTESHTSIPAQQGDAHEAYFQQENEDFRAWWEAHYAGPSNSTAESSTAATLTSPAVLQKQGEARQWFELQDAWEQFEATTTGIQPVVEYKFQKENPYMGEKLEAGRTRHHAMHVGGVERMYENVLEVEAAVQRDPYNGRAWYELGVRQQSNEREAKAVQALRRSLELDPSYLPAWLALAVSYTNENNRMGTYNAVLEWVSRNPDPRYSEAVKAWRDELSGNGSVNFYRLVDLLIDMARISGGGTQEVDADVQIALAVLLNTMEDYSRALDCFLTALAVRPDDWLLYNRVGATMANSGRADEALQYYYRALELNPGYIRARYNLGISSINLRRHEEAATHILDALVLQDREGGDTVETGGAASRRGVTSSALWDSLKTTCLHLQRVDLASMCDHRDLDGFRSAFQGDL